MTQPEAEAMLRERLWLEESDRLEVTIEGGEIVALHTDADLRDLDAFSDLTALRRLVLDGGAIWCCAGIAHLPVLSHLEASIAFARRDTDRMTTRAEVSAFQELVRSKVARKTIEKATDLRGASVALVGTFTGHTAAQIETRLTGRGVQIAPMSLASALVVAGDGCRQAVYQAMRLAIPVWSEGDLALSLAGRKRPDHRGALPRSARLAAVPTLGETRRLVLPEGYDDRVWVLHATPVKYAVSRALGEEWGIRLHTLPTWLGRLTIDGVPAPVRQETFIFDVFDDLGCEYDEGRARFTDSKGFNASWLVAALDRENTGLDWEDEHTLILNGDAVFGRVDIAHEEQRIRATPDGRAIDWQHAWAPYRSRPPEP